MTALWIVLAVVTVLVGLCLIPVRVLLIYDETRTDALCCDLSVLSLRFKLVPGKQKKKKKHKEPSAKTEEKKKSPFSSAPIDRVLSILKLLPTLLGKIVIPTFTLRCFFGGEEDDYPLKYGEAWAVLGTVIPVLEELLDIRARDYSVAYDPAVQGFRLYFNGSFSITLGKLLLVLLHYLLQFSKVEKGGMKHE